MRLVSVCHNRSVFQTVFTNFLLINAQLTDAPTGIANLSSPLINRQPVALGEGSGPHVPRSGDDKSGGDSSGGGGMSDEDALQARLDALRRG